MCTLAAAWTSLFRLLIAVLICATSGGVRWSGYMLSQLTVSVYRSCDQCLMLIGPRFLLPMRRLKMFIRVGCFTFKTFTEGNIDSKSFGFIFQNIYCRYFGFNDYFAGSFLLLNYWDAILRLDAVRCWDWRSVLMLLARATFLFYFRNKSLRPSLDQETRKLMITK